jgi:hypothetical protein
MFLEFQVRLLEVELEAVLLSKAASFGLPQVEMLPE